MCCDINLKQQNQVTESAGYEITTLAIAGFSLMGFILGGLYQRPWEDEQRKKIKQINQNV